MALLQSAKYFTRSSSAYDFCMLKTTVQVSRALHVSTRNQITFSNILPKFLGGKRKRNVAVINLYGMIQQPQPQNRFGGSKSLNLDSLEKHIEKAFSLKRLEEVCLLINSPGGSPVQSELITDKIMRCSKDKDIHIVSFVEDTAASGGYWLACAGKEIFAAQNSVIGSIGVVIGLFGFHELIKQYGIERRVYTAGKNKVKLDVFSEEKQEDVEWAKKILFDIHENFKDYVKQRRGVRLKGSDEVLYNGDVWLAKNAVELGLIDGIQTFDGYIKQKYGTDVNIVRINPLRRTGLAGLFQSSLPSFHEMDLLHKYKFY